MVVIVLCDGMVQLGKMEKLRENQIKGDHGNKELFEGILWISAHAFSWMNGFNLKKERRGERKNEG